MPPERERDDPDDLRDPDALDRGDDRFAGARYPLPELLGFELRRTLGWYVRLPLLRFERELGGLTSVRCPERDFPSVRPNWPDVRRMRFVSTPLLPGRTRLERVITRLSRVDTVLERMSLDLRDETPAERSFLYPRRGLLRITRMSSPPIRPPLRTDLKLVRKSVERRDAI